MKNVPESRRSRREALFEEVRRKRGEEYEGRLDTFWKLRISADYDEPELYNPSPYQADVDRFRTNARDNLSLIEREFEFYKSEVDNFLDSARKTGTA
jgi:hypothetical protein